MERRTLMELIVSICLVIIGIITVILPIFDFSNVKLIFIVIIALYGLLHFIKYFMTLKSKDYSSLYTGIASIFELALVCFIDISDSPWNLAVSLFIWIILISLIKLKESDYYNDRKNKLWKLNIINLILFIIVGILATINLYCTNDVQILVLGFFFLINGILELMDPLVAYLIEKK